MKKILLVTTLVAATSTQSLAVGIVERACLGSSRQGASRALCGCIQQAANLTLSGSDQKMASGFFKDPQKAQDIRQSDRRTHEAFWQRYKQFGATAQAYCSN